MPGILNLVLVLIMAEQAKHILVLKSSTRDVITRIEKCKPTDDILRTLDLIVTDLQKQTLLPRAWSIELMLSGWAAFHRDQFDASDSDDGPETPTHQPQADAKPKANILLSKDTALMCEDLVDFAHIFKYCAAKEGFQIECSSVVEKAMSKAFVRSCNRCKTEFIKESGCNNVTCYQCHNTQCYISSENVTG